MVSKYFASGQTILETVLVDSPTVHGSKNYIAACKFYLLFNMKAFFTILCWIFLLLSVSSLTAAETIIVKTKAPHNREAVFRYRVPKGYDKARREMYRILVVFGGRNTDGKKDASGRMGWGEWCDAHDIFLVAPGFKDDNYWDPKDWSGEALQKALIQLKKEYNVCTDKLLFYGYSAGSQASNLFPAWKPTMCRAWVSHACGVFHEPSSRMRSIPGLVTCGDADKARYVISRDFVEKSRRLGINIVWRSFPNLAHDVTDDSQKLARAFLLYYHLENKDDLIPGKAQKTRTSPVKFIGDDQEAVYYPAESAKAKNVLPEDRVEFPDQSIAEAWGKLDK